MYASTKSSHSDLKSLQLHYCSQAVAGATVSRHLRKSSWTSCCRNTKFILLTTNLSIFHSCPKNPNRKALISQDYCTKIYWSAPPANSWVFLMFNKQWKGQLKLALIFYQRREISFSWQIMNIGRGLLWQDTQDQGTLHMNSGGTSEPFLVPTWGDIITGIYLEWHYCWDFAFWRALQGYWTVMSLGQLRKENTTLNTKANVSHMPWDILEGSSRDGKLRASFLPVKS